MEQIEVTIDAEGEVKVEAKGVVGHGCLALTAAVEQALGQRIADSAKSEMHQQAQVQNNVAARR